MGKLVVWGDVRVVGLGGPERLSQKERRRHEKEDSKNMEKSGRQDKRREEKKRRNEQHTAVRERREKPNVTTTPTPPHLWFSATQRDGEGERERGGTMPGPR